ncbi:MAG TPA: zinc ribbon domain-containing protein, partial [Vicinamibacterales bacterium]|nr:zinc ribbon domain-containing protein [Vicinamibacterales bacterium]
TTKRKIVYYRCIGQDNWRHVGGRVCHSRPIRADELEPLVWGEVRRLLDDRFRFGWGVSGRRR